MKNLFMYTKNVTPGTTLNITEPYTRLFDVETYANANQLTPYAVIKQAQNLIFVCSKLSDIKGYLNLRLVQNKNSYVQLNGKVYFITNFDDINRFNLNGDTVRRSMELEHKALRLETQELIASNPMLMNLFLVSNQNYMQFEETIDMLLSAQSDELSAYEIDTRGTLVPNEMMCVYKMQRTNIWYAEGECSVHSETRIKYAYEVTLKDKCLMLLQLEYYKANGIQPMKRVFIQHGYELVTPNCACDLTDDMELSGIFTYITD